MVVRVYWAIHWGNLYGRYPFLGFRNFRLLLSAATLWQGGNNERLRLPKNPIFRKELILDSGGFALLTEYPDYPFSEEQYFTLAARLGADYVAARDIPCEPWGKLAMPIPERIEKTVEAARRIKERLPEAAGIPLPVIQGWEPADYLDCIDQLKAGGLLADRMAVGSCCKRSSLGEILDVARTVREALPDWVKLHFFGLKTAALCAEGFDDIAYSVDTGAWTFGRGAEYIPWTADGRCSKCGKEKTGESERGNGHLHRQTGPEGQLDAFYFYRYALKEKVAGRYVGEEPTEEPISMEERW